MIVGNWPDGFYFGHTNPTTPKQFWPRSRLNIEIRTVPGVGWMIRGQAVGPDLNGRQDWRQYVCIIDPSGRCEKIQSLLVESSDTDVLNWVNWSGLPQPVNRPDLNGIRLSDCCGHKDYTLFDIRHILPIEQVFRKAFGIGDKEIALGIISKKGDYQVLKVPLSDDCDEAKAGIVSHDGLSLIVVSKSGYAIMDNPLA